MAPNRLASGLADAAVAARQANVLATSAVVTWRRMAGLRFSVRRGGVKAPVGALLSVQRWARSATGMRTSSDTLSLTRRSMVMRRFTLGAGLPSAEARHCWAR